MDLLITFKMDPLITLEMDLLITLKMDLLITFKMDLLITLKNGSFNYLKKWIISCESFNATSSAGEKNILLNLQFGFTN